MPVKQSSIEWFVHGRKLDDFHAFKTVTPEQIDSRLLSDLPVPDFYTDPFHHQKLAYYIGMTRPTFLFFLDLGLGKTKIILDIIKHRKPRGTLVLVPNVSNIYGWLDEIQIHSPIIKAVGLVGSSEEKWEAFKEPADVYLLNYAGLVALVTNSDKKTNKWVIDEKLLARLPDFEMLVMDESTAVKNPRSLAYKVCNKLSLAATYRYALTGTPFGRDPADLWAQFYLVDRGETLGFTQSFFRSCFFNVSINRWGGRDYTFKRSMDKDLHRLCANRSIFISESECQDLPPSMWQTVSFTVPEATKAHYNEALHKLCDGNSSFSAREGNFIKTRQITSGFVHLKDSETDTRSTLRFPDNPKLDCLKGIVGTLPLSSKMLVFHEFLETGAILSECLEDNGIGYGLINSRTKDKAAVLSNFKNNDRVRVLLLNNQSGAFGLNLQHANYCVFYESPVSPIIRRQCEKRLHRTGQLRTVHYYDLCGRGTVDERVLEFLKQGKDLFKSVVAGKSDLRNMLKAL